MSKPRIRIEVNTAGLLRESVGYISEIEREDERIRITEDELESQRARRLDPVLTIT